MFSCRHENSDSHCLDRASAYHTVLLIHQLARGGKALIIQVRTALGLKCFVQSYRSYRFRLYSKRKAYPDTCNVHSVQAGLSNKQFLMPDEDKNFGGKTIYTLLKGKRIYGLLRKLDCLHITSSSLIFEKSRRRSSGVVVYLSSDC